MTAAVLKSLAYFGIYSGMAKAVRGLFCSLSLTLTLSACVSVDEMEAATPVRIVASDNAQTITADCIYSAVLGIDRDDSIRRTATAGVLHITADQGDPRILALYDIAILKVADRASVELRAKGNIWGTTDEPSEISKIIADCSGAK